MRRHRRTSTGLKVGRPTSASAQDARQFRRTAMGGGAKRTTDGSAFPVVEGEQDPRNSMPYAACGPFPGRRFAEVASRVGGARGRRAKARSRDGRIACAGLPVWLVRPSQSALAPVGVLVQGLSAGPFAFASPLYCGNLRATSCQPHVLVAADMTGTEKPDAA